MQMTNHKNKMLESNMLNDDLISHYYCNKKVLQNAFCVLVFTVPLSRFQVAWLDIRYDHPRVLAHDFRIMGATFEGKMNQSVIETPEANLLGSHRISNNVESLRTAGCKKKLAASRLERSKMRETKRCFCVAVIKLYPVAEGSKCWINEGS